MPEFDNIKPANPGSKESAHLTRLQDATLDKSDKGKIDNAQKPKESGATNEAASPKYADDFTKQKIAEIASPKNQDRLFQRLLHSDNSSSKALIEKTLSLTATKLLEEKIATEKIPGYSALSNDAKEQKKEEFLKSLAPAAKQALYNSAKESFIGNGTEQLLAKDQLWKETQKHILEQVRSEINKNEFGEFSRTLYSTYVDDLNENVNEVTKALVKQDLAFPISDCPIQVPADKFGAYSIDRFRKAITNDEVQCRLPNYGKDSAVAPGLKQLDELIRAENFLAEGSTSIAVANIHTQVKSIADKLQLIYHGKAPAGLLPDDRLTTKGADFEQASDYKTRMAPLLSLMEKVNDHARAIKALKEAPDLIGSSGARLLDGLLKDFPGETKQNGSQFNLAANFPTDLQNTADNRGKIRALEEWVDRVHSPLKQIAKEVDFANKNPDSVCYWAKLAVEVVDKSTGNKFNQIQYRYSAEPVKVQVMGPDGRTDLADRIKVTTSKQAQWAGFMSNVVGATDIGKPVVSGRATVNGNLLDEKGSALNLKNLAEVRLNKEGIIQVKPLENEKGIKLVDVNGKAYTWKAEDKRDNEWFDLLPGQSLFVGDEKIDLKNDVRLYKPEQTVCIKGSSHYPHLLKASELPEQMKADARAEFLSEAVPLAVDVGFAFTGLLEAKVIYTATRVASKVSAEVLAERAMVTAANALARRETTALSASEAAETLSVISRTATLAEEAASTMAVAEEVEAAAILAENLETSQILAQRLAQHNLSPESLAKTARSRNKHLALGILGPVRHPVEDWLNEAGGLVNYDRLGTQLYTARGLFMSADILASATNTPKLGLLGGPSRTWNSYWAHDQALVKATLGTKTFLGTGKALNEKLLGLADMYYLPSAALEAKEEVHLFNRGIAGAEAREKRSLVELDQRLKNFSPQPLEHKMAERLVSFLHANDREEVKNALNNLSVDDMPELARETKVNESAAAFLDENRPKQTKLIAALALLKLRTGEDGSLPKILAANNSDTGIKPAVLLNDVRDFLLQYNPPRFNDLEKQPLARTVNESLGAIAHQLGQTDKSVLIDETNKALALPVDDPKREGHINKLADIFQNEQNPQNNRTAAALGLLFLATDQSNGEIKQELGDRLGWQIDVSLGGLSKITNTVWGKDEDTAKTVTMKPYSNANMSVSIADAKPITETVYATEVLAYLYNQLSKTKPITSDNSELTRKADKSAPAQPQYIYAPETRLALADLLAQCNQISAEERGANALEIFSDARTNWQTKANALLDNEHPRVAELLAQYNESGFTKTSEEIIEKLLNNRSEDANLRAFAMAAQSISNIGSDINTDSSAYSPEEKATLQEKRNAEFKTLRTKWQEMHQESGRSPAADNKGFADFYANTLLKQLDATGEKNPALAYEAAKSLCKLNDTGIKVLSAEQKKLVFDTMLGSLASVHNPDKSSFLDKTRLFKNKESEERAQASLSILAQHANLLSKDQMSALRERFVDIFKLPNQGNDGAANAIGESQLKRIALSHIETVYANAPEADRMSLGTALKSDISILTLVSPQERLNLKLDDLHKHLLKEEMSSLTLLARTDNSATNELKEFRAQTTEYFKELAFSPSNASAFAQSEIIINALRSLNALRPIDGLYQSCSQRLEIEKNIAVREEIEGLQKLIGQQDPSIYNIEYLRSKRSIQNAIDTVDLSSAEINLSGYNGLPDVLLATDAKAQRLESALSPNERLSLLEQYVDKVTNAALTAKSAEEMTKFANILAYLPSANGHPVAAPFNADAVRLSIKGWQRLNESDKPEMQKITAPLGTMLLLNASNLPYAERQVVLQGLLQNKVLTNNEKATIMSMALEQAIRQTPHSIIRPDFKENQNYQLALLEALTPLQSSEQIPLLAAIIDEKSKSSLEKDENGLVNKVNYADGSSRIVTRENGQVITLCHKDKEGKENTWIKDSRSNNFYGNTDLEKKQAWNCKMDLLANGDLVINDAPDATAILPENYRKREIGLESGKVGGHSPGGTITGHLGSRTIYTREGAQVTEVNMGFPKNLEEWEMSDELELDGRKVKINDEVNIDGVKAKMADYAFIWAQVRYPDGEVLSRCCDAAGNGWGTLIGDSKNAGKENDPRKIDFLQTSPVWLRDLKIGVRDQSIKDGYDRSNHAFYRVDSRPSDSNAPRTISYETKIEPSGSVVTKRLVERQNPKRQSHSAIIRSEGTDTLAAHPMPLVRAKAASLLGQITKDAPVSEYFAKTAAHDTSANSDQLAQRLREQYGTTKLAIETSKNNSLVEFQQDLISKNRAYMLLDDKERDNYAQQQATGELWWFQFGYGADYEKASLEAKEAAIGQLRGLKSDANNAANKPGKLTSEEAQTALLHIAKTNRGFIGDQAVAAVAERCEGNAEGASEMIEVVTNNLIGEATIGTANRKVLFESLEKHLQKNNTASAQALVARAACQVLEIECQTMPQKNYKDAYARSEQLQVECLGFLKNDVNYRDGNVATVKAIYELSPSAKVRLAAAELLNLPVEKIEILKGEIALDNQKNSGSVIPSKSNLIPSINDKKNKEKTPAMKSSPKVGSRTSDSGQTLSQVTSLPQISIDGA